jgi:hypothetical protein
MQKWIVVLKDHQRTCVTCVNLMRILLKFIRKISRFVITVHLVLKTPNITL